MFLFREVRHGIPHHEGLDVLHEGFHGRDHAADVCIDADNDQLVALRGLGQLEAVVGIGDVRFVAHLAHALREQGQKFFNLFPPNQTV